MTLDFASKAMMEQIAALGAPPLHELSPELARERSRAMVAAAGPAPRMARVEDHVVAAFGGSFPVRVLVPEQPARGVIVYYHGGGWVIGDLYTHDGICRSLVNAAGCAVASVDYRLAPEFKYPTPVEDSWAGLQWVVANGARLGLDPARMAVGGDSAGGNLAAVMALLARDRRGPRLALQLLIYPVTNYAFDTASYRDNANGYLLEKDAMEWFWNHYLRNDAERANPYASPLRAANLKGLPPALVITAEFDPLRDEGEAYAAKLAAADVDVRCVRYLGMNHGFARMAAVFPQASKALDDMAAALRTGLSRK